MNFKRSDRDANDYKDLDLDEKRAIGDVTTIYRTITGACSFGCEQFINRTLNDVDKVSLREAIRYTVNEYGGKQFAAFYQV